MKAMALVIATIACGDVMAFPKIFMATLWSAGSQNGTSAECAIATSGIERNRMPLACAKRVPYSPNLDKLVLGSSCPLPYDAIMQPKNAVSVSKTVGF